MKATFKVLVALFGLGAVLLLGLHLFLQYGLTKTMRDVVLPKIEAETGVVATVGRLSINLPNGILRLSDVAVQNPPGFYLENRLFIKRINVEVDLLSLLKKKLIRVKNIEVEEGLINVIRNKNGDWNMSSIQEETPPLVGGKLDLKAEKHSHGQEPIADTPSVESAEFPEVLIEVLQSHVQVHYFDFKLNQLDFMLDLSVIASNLSTQKDPAAAWAEIAVIGSLGSQRTRFVTDLQLRLAPFVDPQMPSFDLMGKVLEIDPRILEEVYRDLGIRSAPFGLDPQIHCREGMFTNSTVALNLPDLVFEEKLVDRLGGMASANGLRFSFPIEGSLQEPEVDLKQALYSHLGGNAKTLLGSFLSGVIAKETGQENPPENLTEVALAVLGEQVDEIAESETIQDALKDLAGGESSDTNRPSLISSDTFVEILGEQVDEVGENEELKEELKNLGKWLFGQ